MLTSPFVSYETFTCFGYPWKKWIGMHIAYTRTDIIICTHARVFGAPDIITIWVWIKPHHSASIPSPFTNKRIIWWDTIRCTESRSNEFFEWSKLKSRLRRTFWHASTSISTRFDESKKPTTTIENLIIVMMMPLGGLHLTPKWYDPRLPGDS